MIQAGHCQNGPVLAPATAIILRCVVQLAGIAGLDLVFAAQFDSLRYKLPLRGITIDRRIVQTCKTASCKYSRRGTSAARPADTELLPLPALGDGGEADIQLQRLHHSRNFQ